MIKHKILQEVQTVGRINPNVLVKADCLKAMPYIQDASIDMILTDLPYGSTACSWDSIIPFNRHVMVKRGKKLVAVYEDEYILESVKKGVSYLVAKATFDKLAIDGLWENYKRIIKPNGAIVLTASQPFTSTLVMSNIGWFKNDWVWDKKRPSSGMGAKVRPLKKTEDIIVFGTGKLNYYPIMKRVDYRVDKPRIANNGGAFGGKDVFRSHTNNGLQYPKNIIEISNADQKDKKHPTQKPVALMEYLILTYTNKGDLVLDNTAGSGTTGVAAQNLERQWIMIEMDQEDKYIKIIEDRMNMGRQGRMFL